jgi:hypothetical protein
VAEGVGVAPGVIVAIGVGLGTSVCVGEALVVGSVPLPEAHPASAVAAMMTDAAATAAREKWCLMLATLLSGEHRVKQTRRGRAECGMPAGFKGIRALLSLWWGRALREECLR